MAHLTQVARGLVVLLMVAAHAAGVTNNGRCGITSVTGSIQNCVAGSNDIVLIIPSFMLNMHNCMMTTQACVNITKPIKSGTLHYSCNLSGGGKMSGTADLCAPEKKLPKQIVDVMANLNLPNKCPIAASTLCPKADSKVNMTNLKSALPLMLGSSTCNITIEADAGNACIKATMTIKTFQRMIG